MGKVDRNGTAAVLTEADLEALLKEAPLPHNVVHSEGRGSTDRRTGALLGEGQH